ncbi:MAG: transcriptional repressor LexA [Candidatus Omnitrophota bacterium]|jgi:repressor LexA
MKKEKLLLYLDKIKGFYFKKKRMPSYSEMLSIFSLSSKNAAFKRVSALIKAGLLEKDDRGRLIPKKAMRAVPILGSIQAGFPSPAEEELQDVVSIDEYLVSNPNATFLVNVRGDSMIEAGIHQGDLVLIQKGLDPKDGDIVIARVDNEWTLKYFKQKAKKVYLQAANQKYPTIIPKHELIIAGVVIANIRKYK